MISRVNNDANKNAFNALIRAGWKGFADEFVDLGADSHIGADGTNTNATYFNSDGTHLTDAGYAIVTTAVQAAINRILGNSPSSRQSWITLSPTVAPSCTAFIAGQLQYAAGATGAKDTVQVCAKDATNAYAWRTIY